MRPAAAAPGAGRPLPVQPLRPAGGARAARAALACGCPDARDDRGGAPEVAVQAAPLALASGAAAAASLAATRRRRRRWPRGLRARAVVRPAARQEAGGERAGQLSPAWEEALSGTTGDLFSDPGAYRRMLESVVLTPGDETVGSVRFERVGGGLEDDLLLFLPGIDFSGLFAASQFRGLAADHELWRCFVGPEDRTPFVRLVDAVESWLRPHLDGGRRVVLAGESFGGLLALAVAQRLGARLAGLVLVNPATSINRSGWPLLCRAVLAIPEGEQPPPSAPAESLAQLLEEVQARAVSQPYAYIGSSALLGTALDGAQAGRVASAAASAVVDEQVSPGSGPSAFLRDFLTFPQELARLLPPATVRFRLRSWLRDGCESVEGDLRTRASRKGTLPPTTLICSQEDLLVPSKAEGERLLPLLRPRTSGRAELVRLPGAGHAALLDAKVDLAKLIQKSVVGAGPKKPVDYVGSYESPTLEKIEDGSESVEALASVVSPVFLSADADGTRSFGLDGVPDPGKLGRPVLFVGNHQFLALDLGPLVREFLIEKGFTPRGLAHPSQFPELFPEAEVPPAVPTPSALDAAGLPFELRAAARASLEAVRGLTEGDGSGKGKGRGRGKGQGKGRADAGARGEEDGGRLFNGVLSLRNWGAVPVTPRNFVKLLQQGEAVLLFPGGAAEAMSAPRDKYLLQWPEKTDFVRAAAKYDAVVVPFGGVGCAESLQDVPADWGPLEPVRSLLAERQAEQAKKQEERLSQSEGIGSPDSSRMGMQPQGALPQTKFSTQASAGLGDRWYFSFGRPVDLKDLDPQDAEGCARTYSDLKASVEGEMGWLLQARTKDPYRDFLRRQVYEKIANAGDGGPPKRVKAGPNKGGIVQSYGQRAPSFRLERVA